MTNKTSASSNSSVSPGSGVTDSVWQPSWWHWLISALSGTVEIEKQTARLKQSNEVLRKSNEAFAKSNEELRKSNEERRKNNEAFAKNNEELRRYGKDLRSENERLAELESKIDGLFYKHGISLPRASKPEQH
jgi:septal ring factor EnvC (AmiA/AmiB activator)